MNTVSGFGPWARLFLPDDTPLFKCGLAAAPLESIHQIQAERIKYFFDYFLYRPESCYRFHEFKICLQGFQGLLPLLAPAREHSDPEIRRWHQGFCGLLSAMEGFDLSKTDLNKESDYEFRAARQMAQAAEEVMRGFVDSKERLCPLHSLPDPDTSWERWAMRVSPVSNWKFFHDFFMVSEGTGLRVAIPSFFTNPELYEYPDDYWHPVWGYNPKGRFLQILKEKDPPTWRWLEAAKGKVEVFVAVVKLLSHALPAVRLRAAFLLANNHSLFEVYRENRPEQVPAILKKRLVEERDPEVQQYMVPLLHAILGRADLELALKESGIDVDEWSGLKSSMIEKK